MTSRAEQGSRGMTRTKSGLYAPAGYRENLVVANRIPRRRRRADLHQDLSAIQEETWAQYGGVNLITREVPLGTQFDMYGDRGPEDDQVKVFSVDLQSLREVHTGGLVVVNTFPDTDAGFLHSYNSHKAYLDKRFFPNTGDTFHHARTRQDLQKGTEDPTKITVVRSLEGVYNFKGDYLKLLDQLYVDGIRTIMPVHNPDNDLGTGHSKEPKDGLTNLGKEFVRKALDLGIAMDLSHASTETSNDILDIIANEVAQGKDVPAPLISHTGAFGFVNHTSRSAVDRVIIRVAEMNGIIGIVPIKRCVAKDVNNASVVDYVDTIEYVLNLLTHHGIQDPTNHVAIGTDYNGMMKNSIIPGLDDIVKFHNALDDEFAQRGYPELLQHKILYQNAADYFARNLPDAAKAA